MSTPNSSPPSIAILGGGITGLAAALQLSKNYPSVNWKLFEASPRLGGVLETITQNGWQIELSADNFLTRDPWALDLCKKVGLEPDLLPTETDRRRAMVVNRGVVKRVPEGFVLMAPRRISQILTSSVLSLSGKIRLACEPLIPRKQHAMGEVDLNALDESVASFARRRLGREAMERLVQPLVAGIYTADPEKLSMAATLPQFLRQEAEQGSLWRAAQQSSKNTQSDRGGTKNETLDSGARYGLFMAPRLGMQQLVDAITNQLPSDRLIVNQPVGACRPNSNRSWELLGTDEKSLGDFDAVLSTLPSYHSASLVEGFDPSLSGELASVEYAGASVVCLGVKDEQIGRPIDGFGFVVPSVEQRQTIATSFSSYKFPGRTPEGCTLIRTFVGGAMQAELAELADEDLIALVRKDLGDLIGLEGEPLITHVARWPKRMPQYHVGHLAKVKQVKALTANWKGLALAGAAYDGVGVPQCIHSGEQAIDQLMVQLGT